MRGDLKSIDPFPGRADLKALGWQRVLGSHFSEVHDEIN